MEKIFFASALILTAMSINITHDSAHCTNPSVAAEIESFRRDWASYCKPLRMPRDGYRMIKTIYAAPECEFGAAGGFQIDPD